MRLLLVAPEDSVTAAIAKRLGGCETVRAAADPPAGVDVAVYRPSPLRPGVPDLAEAERFLRAASRVPRLVVLSSAAVHVPHHHAAATRRA